MDVMDDFHDLSLLDIHKDVLRSGSSRGVCEGTNSVSRESGGQESLTPSRAGTLLEVMLAVCGLEEEPEGCTSPD